MLPQGCTAAGVHEPRGGADLGVGVTRNLFLDEVDKARVALQETQKLERRRRARFF